MHQLPARHPARRGVGPALPRRGPGGRRCPHAGVRVRARPGQRRGRHHPPAHHLPRGDRQRLRDLERVRQPVLARRVPRRRHRAGPPRLPRRRRLRRHRVAHPRAAHDRRPGPDAAPAHRRRGRHPHESLAEPGNLPRLRARRPVDLQGAWTTAPEFLTADDNASHTLTYNASTVYLDVGGTGTVTATVGGVTKTIPVSGSPDIHAVVQTSAPQQGTVALKLSPGLQAYSFTFG
ncbi:hypothetical protein [Amycolatopsis heterodermiae]|uniref:hypothetical protein n=1 Tax=Amycolatopsis heterodermiae TaxID=3110235 RepID=UPI003969FFD3